MVYLVLGLDEAQRHLGLVQAQMHLDLASRCIWALARPIRVGPGAHGPSPKGGVAEEEVRENDRKRERENARKREKER